ncbi:ADP-ribosylation factor-like protein 2-binding protein [Venturia canescens]|uniref:ADP-ribosylation factor-like protein 2-binding protein n=1 Tax=Venturia canescens TaxID=32260 RepID=UPI001C9CA0B3|nr:ADP-ribosylation factor-like protein 2-binding protein [Venturia canescens]
MQGYVKFVNKQTSKQTKNKVRSDAQAQKMSQETDELVIGSLETMSDDTAECDYEIHKEDSQFDEIIGHVEDIFLDDDFQKLNLQFLDKYWQEFEPGEENKLIYMDIFQIYNQAIENYLNKRLHESIPSFSMESFMNQLREKSPNLDGEIFEILSTVTDFLAFKEMILDYRAVKEGMVQDLSSGITVKSLNYSDGKADKTSD